MVANIRRIDRSKLLPRLGGHKLVVNKQANRLRVLASIRSRQRQLEIRHDAARGVEEAKVLVLVGGRDGGMQTAQRKREPERTRTSAEAHGYLWSLLAWMNTLVSYFQQVDPEKAARTRTRASEWSIGSTCSSGRRFSPLYQPINQPPRQRLIQSWLTIHQKGRFVSRSVIGCGVLAGLEWENLQSTAPAWDPGGSPSLVIYVDKAYKMRIPRLIVYVDTRAHRSKQMITPRPI